MANEKTSEQMRDEYLLRVAGLFSQAREWTSNFDATAKITKESVIIKEEPVEAYPADILVVDRPARKIVRLIPRGCWIIGAEGRVDMRSDLGSETLVYVLDGDPAIRIEMMTDNGKVLEEEKTHLLAKNVKEGWVLVQNRQLGMLPPLDAKLFCRLLEVLGR